MQRESVYNRVVQMTLFMLANVFNPACVRRMLFFVIWSISDLDSIAPCWLGIHALNTNTVYCYYFSYALCFTNMWLNLSLFSEH